MKAPRTAKEGQWERYSILPVISISAIQSVHSKAYRAGFPTLWYVDQT